MDVNQRNGYALSRRLESERIASEKSGGIARKSKEGAAPQQGQRPALAGRLPGSFMRFDQSNLAGWSLRPSGPALTPIQVRALALVLESVELFRRKSEGARAERARRTRERSTIAPAHSVRTATEGPKIPEAPPMPSNIGLKPDEEAAPISYFWQECEEIAEFDIECELSSPEGFVLKVSAHVVLTRKHSGRSDVEVEMSLGDHAPEHYNVRHLGEGGSPGRAGSTVPPAHGEHFWLG